VSFSGSLKLLRGENFLREKNRLKEKKSSVCNRSARKAYQKIFGYKGDRYTSQLIYFSTQP
jgi:hypothetical protein